MESETPTTWVVVATPQRHSPAASLLRWPQVFGPFLTENEAIAYATERSQVGGAWKFSATQTQEVTP